MNFMILFIIYIASAYNIVEIINQFKTTWKVRLFFKNRLLIMTDFNKSTLRNYLVQELIIHF